MLLIIVGIIISILASILTYWGIGLFNESPWYLFLILAFIATYFILYLNIYWLIALLSFYPYTNKDFVGKVDKWNLFHVRATASFCVALQNFWIKKKGFIQAVF